MNLQTPMAALNNAMAKVPVLPRYELMFKESISNGITVMMRVTCPLTSVGEPLTAYSNYCGSEKEAKHSAAVAFLNKYLRNKVKIQYSLPRAKHPRREQDRDYYAELEDLEAICYQYDVDPPMYVDVSSEHSRTQMFECHVSDLVTEGSGKNKVIARRQATRRMIEMLTNAGNNYETIDSSGSTASPHDNEIVSSSEDPREYDSNPPDVHTASAVPLVEECRACRDSDSAETLLRSLNLLNDSEIKESEPDSGSNLKPKYLEQDSQRGISSTKRSGPRSYNGQSDVANRFGSSSSPDESRKLTQLQAVSRINRSFRNLERELHENILDALVHTEIPHTVTVKILRQKFTVIINQDSLPMIFDEHHECSDQSIRVACLTKLFQDLMDRCTTKG